MEVNRMNYKSNLAYVYDSEEKSVKNNVVAFSRQKGHGKVEAKIGVKDMKRTQEEKSGKSNKAVIFVRVSSREQKEGYSIDAQLARLRDYCKRKDLEVINEFEVVESSTRGERTEFYNMINFIKRQK